MNWNSTIAWRLAVLGLIVSLVPLGHHALEEYNKVDTGRMLDVSVSIRTTSHVTVDKFGDSVWEISNGSGFLVSSRDCEVWTNHHVVADAALIEVFPRGWNRTTGIPAKLVNATPRPDIAIIQLEECDGIPAAVLGDSGPLKPGDETFAVGNPMGRNPHSITRGIISHTQRFRESSIPYLQTDAAINPGNSGGALFDREGRVIGINTALESTRDGANVGVGYAVPINLVMQTVSELRNGPPSWGDAGISDIVTSLTPDEAEVFLVPDGKAALVVTHTPEEGPSAGKLFAHDVIYQIGETEIENTEQAIRAINQREVGESLALALMRDGESRQVEIVLGEGWQANDLPAPDSYEGYLGMTLEMWEGEEGDRGQFTKPVITRVHSLGPAHKAHVASTQKSLLFNRGFVVPYFIDVKTVTGVAYRGKYHSISTIEEIENFAAAAYEAGDALLLEIELWRRENPRNLQTTMELAGTGFYRLQPRRAEAGFEDVNRMESARGAPRNHHS